MSDLHSSSVTDGEVNSDVSAFRDSGYIVRFPGFDGVTCYQCGSGEVWQPMQTMDMPMFWACLRCGEHAPGGEFEVVEDAQ